MAIKGPVGSEKAALLLQQLEIKLEQLRRKFQNYFNGFDKTPPTLEFDALKREFREFGMQQYSTAQARFKAQNLLARWNLLRSTFERDLQRMEEGKFKPNAHHASHSKDLKPIDDLD